VTIEVWHLAGVSKWGKNNCMGFSVGMTGNTGFVCRLFGACGHAVGGLDQESGPVGCLQGGGLRAAEGVCGEE
jgi:hypothetical protein